MKVQTTTSPPPSPEDLITGASSRHMNFQLHNASSFPSRPKNRHKAITHRDRSAGRDVAQRASLLASYVRKSRHLRCHASTQNAVKLALQRDLVLEDIIVIIVVYFQWLIIKKTHTQLMFHVVLSKSIVVKMYVSKKWVSKKYNIKSNTIVVLDDVNIKLLECIDYCRWKDGWMN